MKISFLDGLSNMKRKVILSSASVAKEKSYLVQTLNYSLKVWQQQKDLDARVKTCLTFSVASF